MRFQNVLFDLDGTLSASAPGITRSAQYALHKMGIEEPDASKLTFFVGPPLNLTFREHYGMDDHQTAQAVGYFQEQYDSKGIFESELYPGVKEMLQTLAADGCRLAIASSKPVNLVHKVLEHFGIEDYFAVIVGSAPDAELDNKAGADNKQLMVRQALGQLGVGTPGAKAPVRPETMGSETQAAEQENAVGNAGESGAEPEGKIEGKPEGKIEGKPDGKIEGNAEGEDGNIGCAMVGDRFYDIEGAKANHVFAVGVSYGYGSRKELAQAGADFIADSVEELRQFLCDD